MFDSIQDAVRDRLHWLPVPKRIYFKLCLLTLKAINGLAPPYLTDLCRPVSAVDQRQRLRSAARGDLVVDNFVTDFGRRSFTVAAPMAWNALPVALRSLQTVNSFKAALKTFLLSHNLLFYRQGHARPCKSFTVLRRVRNCQCYYYSNINIIIHKLHTTENTIILITQSQLLISAAILSRKWLCLSVNVTYN